MNIKFHRFKVFSSDNKAFGFGATWVIGFGIFLCASAVSVFRYLDVVHIVYPLILLMISLSYLSSNITKLHYIITVLSIGLCIYFGFKCLPYILSSNIKESGYGLYSLAMCIYFIGIMYIQVKVIKNSNKAIK